MAEQAEHQHAVRAEAEALRAELEELRLQLDPHFLFNALNGVAEEIPERPAAALAMLRDLTAYLRHSLDGINQTVVTVGGRGRRPVGLSPRAAGALRRSAEDDAPRRPGGGLAPHRELPAAAAGRECRQARQARERAGPRHRHPRGGRCAACRDREYRFARRCCGLAPAPSRDWRGERAPAPRPALSRSPPVHARRSRRRRDKVVATLVLEGEPCGS